MTAQDAGRRTVSKLVDFAYLLHESLETWAEIEAKVRTEMTTILDAAVAEARQDWVPRSEVAEIVQKLDAEKAEAIKESERLKNDAILRFDELDRETEALVAEARRAERERLNRWLDMALHSPPLGDAEWIEFLNELRAVINAGPPASAPVAPSPKHVCGAADYVSAVLNHGCDPCPACQPPVCAGGIEPTDTWRPEKPPVAPA